MGGKRVLRENLHTGDLKGAIRASGPLLSAFVPCSLKQPTVRRAWFRHVQRIGSCNRQPNSGAKLMNWHAKRSMADWH
jgi:hypothetical protein